MKRKSVFGLIFGFGIIAFAALATFASCEVGLGSAVDVEPPVLEITTPPTSAVIRDKFAIAGTWTDDGSIKDVSVSLRNTGTKKTLPALKGEITKDPESKEFKGDWNVIIDPSKQNLADGSYEATITMRDNGNHKTIITRSFIIDNTPPVVVLQRPSTSAKDENSIPDLFGQTLSLTGQAADDNNIKKIRVNIYSDPECTNRVHYVDIPNVPPTISLDVAKFVENEDNDYAKIYGSTIKEGKKPPVYCTIVAYDEAQRYPVTEAEAKEDDELGNSTDSYYLYDEIYTDVLSEFKVTEIYSIMNGSFNPTDNSRAATASSIPEILKPFEIKTGKFQLNPANNPEYKVVGREGLELDDEGNILPANFKNPANDLTNESNITVKVDVGLDAIPLNVQTLRVYLLPCDANGNPVEDTVENRIYPDPSDPPYEKNGTGYTFTTKIIKDACKDKDGNAVLLTIGNPYIIAIEGSDSKGNPAVAEEGKIFGFRLAPNGAAPIIDVNTSINSAAFVGDSMVYVPRFNPADTTKLTTLKFKGTVSVEDGEPTVEFSLDGKARQALTITPTGNKGEYSFDKEITVDDFVFESTEAEAKLKSGQHNIIFYASQTQDATPVKKTLMYQVDGPKVTLSSVEPTAYNYYDTDGNLKEDGKAETETVNGKETKKKYLNGKNVKLNVTIIAGAVGLDESDERKPVIEFFQNDELKLKMDSPTFDATEAIDTTQFAEEPLSVRITAYDLAGNKGVVEETYYVKQDTDYPVILPKNSANSTLNMSTKQAAEQSTVKNVYSANQTVSYKLIDDDGLANAYYKIVDANGGLTDGQNYKYEPINNLNGTTDYQVEVTMPDTPGYYKIIIGTEDINTEGTTGSIVKTKSNEFFIRVTAAAPTIQEISLLSTIFNKADTIEPGVQIKSDQVPFTLVRVVKKDQTILSGLTKIFTSDGGTINYDTINSEKDVLGYEKQAFGLANDQTDIATTKLTVLENLGSSPTVQDSLVISNLSSIINSSGKYTLEYRVIDANFKTGDASKEITIDLTPPAINSVKLAGENYSSSKWYNSTTLALEVAATDTAGETGIEAVEYSINGTTWTGLSYNKTSAKYTGSAVFDAEGANKSLYIRARDKAQNTTYYNGTAGGVQATDENNLPKVTVKIDSNAPVLEITSYQIGTLAPKSIDTSNIYVKNGVELKVSGTVKDEESEIGINDFTFTLGNQTHNPEKTTKTYNPNTKTWSWAVTYTIDGTKTLGQLSVKVKNGAGVETTKTPFNVTLDSDEPVLKNISLTTSSPDTQVYKASNTLYYVNNKKTYKVKNENNVEVTKTPTFTISGVASDLTGVAEVKLTIGSNTSKKTTQDFSFDNLDWSEIEEPSIDIIISATDIAGNESIPESEWNEQNATNGTRQIKFTVKFDTEGPDGVHLFDYKEKNGEIVRKDLFFRVGDQENDDITSSSTNPQWSDAIDTDVGGKYMAGTFGNRETIKIRGNFDDGTNGSGVAMIYYKLFNTNSPIDGEITSFVGSPETVADGYFAPKTLGTNRRVFYNNSNGSVTLPTGYTANGPVNGKYYTEIESTYINTISGFTEGHNYLVLVAVDNVGNAKADVISNSETYYTINVDTQPPEITTLSSVVYTNANADKTISVEVTDQIGADIASAGVKKVTVNVAGLEEKTASLSNDKYSVSLTAAELQSLCAANNVKSYTISVSAVDDAGTGNSSTIPVGTLTIDRKAPEITIGTINDADKNTVHPVDNNDTLTGNLIDVNGTLKLSGTSKDETSLASENPIKVEYSADETTWTQITGVTGSNNWSVDIDTTNTTDSTKPKFTDNTQYTIRVTATDSAGNTTTDTKKIYINQNSDRPTVKFTNLVKDGSKYILKYGNAAALEGTITDDDATSAKVVKTFIASSSPISSATATPTGSTIFNAATGDYTFTPASDADGEKIVYFYIVDNNDKEFYTTQTTQLTRPYQQYKTDPKEDNADVLRYNSDSNAPLINSVQLQAYTAATANMETQVIQGENQEVDTTKNGVLTSLGTNCIVGGTTKNYVDLKVSAKDANGVKGVVIKVEQGSRVTYYRSNNSVSETGVSTYANTGTVTATTDDTSDHIYTTSRINITDYVNGQVSVTVKVYDNSGLYNNQESVFAIDRNAPTITIDNNVAENAVVYGINKITIGGTATDTDVDKIYYAVTDNTTASSAVTNWIEVKDQKISAQVIFGGSDSDKDNGEVSDTLRKWIQTVYEYDDEYMTSHDANKLLSIHFKAVDACGNPGYSKRTISVVPNGDKPVITLSYPVDKAVNVHPSLAGTIRIYGNAEVITGNVRDVYVQIDTSYNGTFSSTWETEVGGFNDCISGKNTNYTVETINATVGRGIKATGTLNWNLPINGAKEFNPTGTSETRRVAIRIYGVGGSGKVSEPVTQEFTIDPNAPHIGGSGADAGVMQLKLVQFASGNPLTAAMTYSQAQAAIANQMPYVPGQTVWVKGQWYIAASVYDDSGISSIKLDENISGIDPKYLVKSETSGTAGTIQSNLEITTSQTEKTIFVKANDCSAAINATGKKNFDIYIPLPTSTGSGNVEFTLEAVEASEFNNGSTETVKVNFDNTPPKLGTVGHDNYNANAYNVQQDNGFYRIFGYATDAEGSNLVSDMKAVAFYFVRRGTNTRVYDPMWKNKYATIQTGSTDTSGITYEYGMFWNTKTVGRSTTDLSVLTLTTKDDNIHAGGFVLIGGTIYTIRSVSDNGLTITLKTEAPAGITTAKFAYAMVIDNFNMTESVDTRTKITNSSLYGYGYYGADATADDGDLMQEKWASGKWEAWINSANIPDGPIEIHYVALDNAQNFSTGIVGNLSYDDYKTKTTLDVSANGNKGTASNNLVSGFDYIYDANKKAYVSNNAPRIAGVTVGTDYNGNGTVEASEKQTKYIELGTRVFSGTPNTSTITKVLQQFNASSDGTATGLPFMKVVDKTSVEMEIVGGNNEMYYRYHITSGCNDTATFINGTYGKDANNQDYTSWQFTRTTNEGYRTDDDGKQGYYTTTKLPAIEFSVDQLKAAIGNANATRWWTIQVWDSTEETTHFQNSQYAELKLPLSVEVLDGIQPNTLINDLYWNSATDNSVYRDSNGKLHGHIELKKDLTYKEAGVTKTTTLGSTYGVDDDKISGLVTFRGYAYDNKRLASLKWGIKNALSGTIKEAWPQEFVTAATFDGTWTSTGSASIGSPFYYLKVYDDEAHGAYLDKRGHKVYWELTIDTSRVQEPGKTDNDALAVGEDLYVYMVATDGADLSTNMNPAAADIITDGEDAENLRPNYKVDVVPYITGIKTRLSKNNKINPEVYSRTAQGHYPIASDETEANSVVLQGYNLASGNADVDISSIISTQTTGAYVYTRGTGTNAVNSINNMNYNDAHGDYDISDSTLSEKTKVQNMYNRTPSTVTNLTLNDDVYLDIWEFKKAATTKNGKLNEPVMRINPSNGMIGFAFANGSDSLSLPNGSSNSYTNWQRNYADYSGINFVYDSDGRAHSISTGLDTEPNSGYAGYMQYILSTWGGNGNNMYNWMGQYTAALESVGIPSGVYVGGTALSDNLIDVKRFGKPAIAVAGTNKVYTAYYDADNDQIRFRSGFVTDTKSGRLSTFGQFSDDKAGAGTLGSGTDFGQHRMFEAHPDYYSLLAGVAQKQDENDTPNNTGNGTSEFVALDVIPGDTVQPTIYECTTAENTYQKTITVQGFTLDFGTQLIVNFSNPIHGSNNNRPTLNVSNTGANELYDNGNRLSRDATSSVAAGTYLLTYTQGDNRNYWNIQPVPDYSQKNDIVVIVWYDGSNLMYTYRYGEKDDTDCSSTGVDDKWAEPKVIFEGFGQYCTIKLDKNNGIHIAAYNRSGADLYYCYMSGYDQYANRKTALVDSYSQVGKYISIDTALNSEGNVIPYISYYGDGFNGLPKLAYLPGGINAASPVVPDGSDDDTDLFTGNWEISLVPTSSEVNEDNMNVALWKNASGVITSSGDTRPSSDYTDPTITSAGTNEAIWYGNGTSEFVLGYGISVGLTGFIETAQLKN